MIFIGGTGRCGTALLGKMFSLHPGLMYFPEPRLIPDQDGLADYVRGNCGFAAFRKKMAGPFRYALVSKLQRTGYPEAQRLYSQDRVEKLLDGMAQFDNRMRAGRWFLDELFGIMVRSTGKYRCVEKTPHTALYADLLWQMFPYMRYIHIIRNPADVYASMLRQRWGPRTAEQFADFYCVFMNRANEAQQRVHPDCYLIVSLECLVANPKLVRDVWRFSLVPDVTEEIIHQSKALIHPELAHIGRAKRELHASDYDHIICRCDGTYRYWLAQAIGAEQ
jgi:hypothetical protein